MKKFMCLFCICTMLVTTYAPVFANKQEENSALRVDAKSALLMESSTGKILYEQNPDEKLPIASVTKIMTMLLIMEAIDSGKIKMEDMVVSSERAKSMGGSTMFLDTGEQLSVHDMLKGIAVASANDGSVAMAEHIAGSELGFVNMMNERAKELGMENTNFENTNGLDSDNHYSSARDVAIMSRELIQHEKIFEFTTIWMDTLRDGKFQLANTNKLIRFYSGANGLKTGSTSKALCCLSATAKRDNMQLISVVLGAPTSKIRFASASSLLDYGFANYQVEPQIQESEIISSVPVSKGVKASVDAIAQEKFSVLTSKGDKDSIQKVVQIDSTLNAPIEKGMIIGKVDFYKGNELVGTVNVLSAEEVAKKSFGMIISDIFRQWLIK